MSKSMGTGQYRGEITNLQTNIDTNKAIQDDHQENICSSTCY